MKYLVKISTCIFFLAVHFFFFTTLAEAQTKNRVIILTDIENEPDDTQSLVRLLLYSNEIDIRGLVATTSIHMRNNIYPETIKRVVDAYGKVHGNLQLHDKDYPSHKYLQSLILKGQAEYGMAGVGDTKDSEGSDRIVDELISEDPRPLWVCAWGGVNTLAQALQSLRKNYPSVELTNVLAKLRVYTISDQDDSGQWLRREFPNLFYIVSPGGYGNATWLGINNADGEHPELVSNEWLAENIQQGHGALGAVYPDVAYGMEGDTPSFLNLIQNGLNSSEDPNWGGWGGRYELYTPDVKKCDFEGFTGGVKIGDETRPIWTNASDTYTPYVKNSHGRAIKKGSKSYSGNQATIWRWREEIQHDFAARMDWCVKPFKQANHPPFAILDTPDKISVKSGETIYINANSSFDPDGDSISFLWFAYPEATGYKGEIPESSSENCHDYRCIAPKVSQPTDIHYILKVTDKGTPSLSRYKRIIVTVTP
ncbi:MAG: DUF1593 domain-containing protein [Bacteroidia bacterium]|nr:DUF1593 domain-containing protein [Bacteroidia bacterium]